MFSLAIIKPTKIVGFIMRVSKKSRYGLRAMVYLANHCLKNKVCSLKKISNDEEIPFDFLEKIFSKLKRAGLIRTKKGIQGGYSLARSPQKIKVGEIIKVLEGTMAPVFCIAEDKRRYLYPRKKGCKIIKVWKKIQRALELTLNSITLADLVNKV